MSLSNRTRLSVPRTALLDRLYLTRRTIRMTRRLHHEFPENGWRWAWANAMVVQRWTLWMLADAPEPTPVDLQLSERDQFEVDVLADIACLPEVEWDAA